MKKYVLTLFMLISFICVISQDFIEYNRIKYKIEYFDYKNNNDSVKSLYNLLIKNYTLLPFESLNALKYFSENNDTLKVIATLKNLAEFGISINSLNQNDYFKQYLSIIDNTPYFNEISLVKSKTDTVLINKINSLLKEDQEIRNLPDSKENWKKMNEIDSINSVEIVKIIKEYGFPSYQKLGIQLTSFLILIMHISTNESTENLWNNYLYHELLKAASNGKILYSDFALINDRYSYAKNGTQIYGTITEDSEYLIIKNIETIDSLRNTIGLPPLYIDAQIKNINLPKNYKYDSNSYK